MINEQHEECNSKEDNDHHILSINQNSSSDSLPKDSTVLTTGQLETNNYLKKEFINYSNVPQSTRIIIHSVAVNSDVKEIRDIIQTIVKAVFCIIDNNIGQLANRSSNTLGMRVKDSLILKVQQTQKKKIPFNELKTSLVCRLIVDDDLQIQFLPRIESPAPSSTSENLSTKQKKSVSLAEKVKIFNIVENEFFSENEIGYLNELMDSKNDRIMNHERTQENEEGMYDFTSQKNFTSPVESESSLLNQFNAGTIERKTSSSHDQKIQIHKTASKDAQRSEPGISSEDLRKFDNSGGKPTILFNTRLISNDDGILQKAQTNNFFTRDRVMNVSNLSIAPSSNANQLIVSLVETTIKGNADTQLIQHGKEKPSKRSKTSNEVNEGILIYDKDQVEKDPTTTIKKDSISNVDIEIKLKKEQSTEQNTARSKSKILDNSDKDNLNDGSDENTSAVTDVGHEKEIVRKMSSKKDIRSKNSHDNTKSSIETFDFVDKIASENSGDETKKTKQIKKWMNKFVYNRKKNTRDKSKAEDQSLLDLQSDQSFINSNQQSSATIVGVTMEFGGTVAKLGPSQAALESNNENKILENGTLSIVVSDLESQNDERSCTPQKLFDLERSHDVAEKINDSEIISDEKELNESLSRSKRVDKDKNTNSENMGSSRDNGDRGLSKFFEETFAAAVNVESLNLVKLHTSSSVQKYMNENKNGEEKKAVIETIHSYGIGNKSEMKEEKEIITHSVNSDPEEDSESKSSCTKAVERDENTERQIPLAHELPDSSSEYKGVNNDTIIATENQEIVMDSEKRTSLFSRIIKSKIRKGKNIVPEKTAVKDDTVIDKKNVELSKIDDQIIFCPEHSSFQGNSEIDLENAVETALTSEAFDTGKIRKKNSNTFLKIEFQELGELSLNDEELKMKSTFDTKMNSLTNSFSLGETLSRVSLNANKLSKKSSRTESSADQQSTNDLSLKQTSSKVSQKACKSSEKLSRIDISDVIISGSNNPAVETLLVSSQDRSDPNQTDAFLVADANANEKEPKLTKKFKSYNKSESSLKKSQTQVYPVAVDNILQLDLLSSAQIKVDDEIDKVEIKSNDHSHWSMFSKKSSAKLKSDKQKISESESSGNDTEDFAKEPIRRKKSMLNVVSKFFKGEDDVIRDNLPHVNGRDITDNKSSKSFLEFRTSKPSNKSDDTLIALQLPAASVNTNIDQSDHPIEQFTNSKKRNRFIEGLKRSLQSKNSGLKSSEGNSETKLKVSSESQTDIDKEFTSESLTTLKNRNNIEQSVRSLQLLDKKLSSSSKTIRDELLIDRKREGGSVSLIDCDDINRFFGGSTEEDSKVTDLVKDVIQKSISEVSKQIAEETPMNIVKVYSAAVDSELKENHFSNCKITDLPSSLDPSQDLGERNSCNVNESDTKSIQNELEFGLKSSEDLESKPDQIEKDNYSFKVNKSFAKILQKLSRGKSSDRTSKCLNDDELSESKDIMQKRSSKDRKTNEENAVNDEEEFSKKSEPIKFQKNSYTDSNSEMDERTIHNSSQIFNEKSESLVIAYVVKPLVQDQSDEQTLIENKLPSDSKLIINKTSEQLQSHDLMTDNKEKHGLISNIKSIFKSLKSELRKNSISSIEGPENMDVINRIKISGSPSEIDVDKEQSVHFMRESVEILPIQSMKSLQDNRKRSKNRRRLGHKLFNDEDPPFIRENNVEKSYQATVPSDFMLRQSEEKIEDLGVGGKANSSEESVAKLNLQILLTDEEEVEEETARVSDKRKKSEKQENPDGNTKKFGISLYRIFSNSSRKNHSVKESRPAADSQTNLEDHFEITRIPLSSSDDSNTKGIDCEITQRKSEVTEDNREELVAIKSLDSMHDSDNHTANREPIVKRSSRVLGSKYTTEISNDELLCPEQSGTVIFSAVIKANHISSENELEKKDSLDSVQEMRKPSEKIHVAKGTIVSYAPMVESAKYISDERDDQFNEDDQSEKRQKRSSGKSFATIRKLFTRTSMKNRQDHTAMEDQVDHEVKKESLNSVKSSIIKHRKDKDQSVHQLNNESKRESIISIKISSEKRINGDKDEDEKQKNCLEINKLQNRSKVKIYQPGTTEDIKSSLVHDEFLLINNVQISRNELAKTQSLKNCIDDSENGTKPAVMQSNEVYVVDNKVEPAEHDGLKPTKIVERVVDEIVIPPARQKDLNNTSDVVQKLSQRSRDTKKDSLLSTAKSYIKRHTEIQKEEMEGANKKSGDKDLITPSNEDLKKISKEQGLAKTESVFSRGLKKLFKKRNSAVESIASTIGSNDTITETETRELGKSKTKETSNGLQFSVYNVNSKSKCTANYEKGGQSLENKISSTSPSIFETHISNGFPIRDNPESENCIIQEKSVAENEFQTKISSKDFRQNPSFGNRRSTIVMMATPAPSRKEPQTEVSHSSNDPHDDSSNSPTAFYYLLGPSLDEALIDVRVVFKNLIDKIIGRGR